MRTKICGIYIITSPTGRIYIGQSVDIIRRFDTYKKLRYPKAQPKLYSSLIKHGVETHQFSILEECPEVDLNDRERFYISKFNSVDSEAGLNLKTGSNRGSRLSEETKQKISKSRKGQSTWIKGKTHSPETRAKISAAAMGNTRSRGRAVSKEWREKISKSLKGKKHSPERIAAMMNGRRLSSHTGQQSLF